MAYSLANTLDCAAASQLRLDLASMINEAQPLNLEGSDVLSVSQACLQVLVAASKSAAQAKLAFEILHPSEALRSMAELTMLTDDLRLTTSE